MQTHIGRTHIWFALATIALASIVGCSPEPIVSPERQTIAPVTRAEVPAPSGTLAASADTSSASSGVGGQVPVPAPSPIPLDWRFISSTPVPAGTAWVVTAGRYTLSFARGSLSRAEIITIMQYDPDILDVQFGPHGTQFGTPVELRIDFTGTASDPGLVRTKEAEPVLWYLDETANRWVIVPGYTDWNTKQYVVYLEHFSRYALGGKAGWKHLPSTEGDGQE